jgi:hypothetical protein
MGAEATCTGRFGGKASKGLARLESTALEFRGGGVRVSIPFTEMTKVAARGGALTVDSTRGRLSLALGAAAATWADRIQHPRSRLEKIGVRGDWRVSAVGPIDQEFLAEVEGAVAQVAIGRVLKESDAIFLGADKEAGLARLDRLVAALKSNGALWVIRPKGRPEISERAVRDAAKRAGLVDVKVVSFSPTHTAEKFVIPVKDRSA